MRSIFAMALVGVFSSISMAYAASDVSPLAVPTNGPSQELRCRFEGRGFDQNESIRCFVRVELCQAKMQPGADRTVCPSNRNEAFEIRCTNGFDLESRDFAVSSDQNNIWINADERGRSATLRLRERVLDEPQFAERRNNAELIIANRVARRLEGKCSFGLEREMLDME